MPEIKHQFTGGKMNKDLDERLVPNGEYRDAWNIQVSTSEGSDVGTVQNILGNDLVAGQDFIDDNSVCVGSIADEKNDKLYYFINQESEELIQDPEITDNTIWSVTGGNIADFSGIGALVTSPGTGASTFPQFDNPDVDLVDGETYQITVKFSEINQGGAVGGRIKAFIYGVAGGANGYRPYYDTSVTNGTHVSTFVFNQSQNNGIPTMRFSVELTNGDDYIKRIRVESVSLIEKTNAIVEYDSNTNSITPVLVDTIGDVLKFDSNNIITGINIIDDLLFWTDNQSEPKKINIQRSIEGTDSSGIIHTKLMNEFQDIDILSNIDIQEKHISVIKESPKSTLGLVFTNPDEIEDKTYSGIIETIADPGVNPNTSSFILNVTKQEVPFDFSNIAKDDVIHMEIPLDTNSLSDFTLDWKVGDTVAFKEFSSTLEVPTLPLKTWIAKGIIEEWSGNNFQDASTSLLRNGSFNLNMNDWGKTPNLVGNPWGGGAAGTQSFGWRWEGAIQAMVFQTGPWGEAGAINPWAKLWQSPVNHNFQVGRIYTLKYDLLDVPAGGLYGGNIKPLIGGVRARILINGDIYNFDFQDTVGTHSQTIEIGGTSANSVQISGTNQGFYNNHLYFQTNDQQCRGVVENVELHWVNAPNAQVQIKITSIDINPPTPANTGIDPLNYVVDKYREVGHFFKDKLARFSYRYKYIDGEYSAFAPFSNVAFSPGTFDYHPKKGHNLGMTNQLVELELNGFVTSDLPEDVESIDILAKIENSPNIYIVDTIKPNDPAPLSELGNPWYLNKYKIVNDTIKGTVPSNQLLRPWDNVPKRALAQEIIGNRLIYGNYTQGYNLLNSLGANYRPEFNITIDSIEDNLHLHNKKSIKSLRDYQLGVVFSDKHGRETPVISNQSGSFYIDKDRADKNNILNVSFLETGHPVDMKYFKLFIKETSNEYYNVAMDRYYIDEDNNIWLSFPSSDRNKIDLETILILKKGLESNDLVEEKADYKVLAIEDEAPDFIKTSKLLIEEKTHVEAFASTDLFGDALVDAPLEGYDNFKMKHIPFQSSSGDRLHEIDDGDLYIEFSLEGNNKLSKRYKINKISCDVDTVASNVDPYYSVKLKTVLGEDVNFITDDINGVAPTKILDNTQVSIYKYILDKEARYEGRFFVKIFGDEIFNEKIQKPGLTPNTKYRVVGGKKLYFMNDDHVNRLVDGIGGHDSSVTGLWNGAYSTQRASGWNTHLDPNIDYPDTDPDYDPYPYSFNSFSKFAVFFRNYKYSSGDYTLNNASNIAIPAGHYKFGLVGDDDWIDEFRSYTSSGDTEWAGGWDKQYDATTNPYPTPDPTRTADKRQIDDEVWFIDNGPYVAHRYTNDNLHWQYIGEPTSKFRSGITTHGDYWNMDIGMGGISYESRTGVVISYSLVDFFGIRVDGGNSSYNDLTSLTLANKMDPGIQFRFKEDPSGTIYKISPTTIRSRLIRYASNHRYGTSNGTNTGGGWAVNEHEIPNLSPNFTNNWKLRIEPEISWNPATGTLGPIANGLEIDIPARTSGTTAYNTTSNIENYHIVLDSGVGIDPAYGNLPITPGLILTEYNGGTTIDIAGGRQYLLVKDIIETSYGNWKVYLCGYEKLLQLADIITPTAGQSIKFQQPTMNGYSENSTNRINTNDPENDGFSIANPGLKAVGYNIEFVEAIVEDVPMPENPAIFETEPKESTNLDIYYEASGLNAITLNETTISTVLPLGSRITPDLSASGIYNPATQTLVYSFIPDNTYIVEYINGNTVKLSNEIPIAGLLSAPGAFPINWNPGILLDEPIQVIRPNGSILYISPTLSTLNAATQGIVIGTDEITFNTDVWRGKTYLNWHNCYSFGNGVESNRVLDAFNKQYISNGVRVSTTLDIEYKEENRKHGLIYSGIYNSNSGINDLNQFIAAEKITKDINPIYGSIQKLHSRDADLVTLCEDKCLRILANKDVIYNSDGNPQLTANENVLGQTIPFSGEFGISKDPESFASESYRVYFTDKVRGAVMRLSKDGLTPISMHGMKDWFKDNLKISNKIIGSYDDKKEEYNVTLTISPGYTNNPSTTVSFKEDSKGWVSFKSFIPEQGISMANDYYTMLQGKLYKHHNESVDRNTFYDTYYNSSINVMLNDGPGSVKSFHTLCYEGSQCDIEVPSVNDGEYYNLTGKFGWFVSGIETDKQVGSLNEFIEKEGKWFNYIKGVDSNITATSETDFGAFDIQGIGSTTANGIIFDNIEQTVRSVYTFNNEINSSLQVGDTIYRDNVYTTSGGFQTIDPDNLENLGTVLYVGTWKDFLPAYDVEAWESSIDSQSNQYYTYYSMGAIGFDVLMADIAAHPEQFKNIIVIDQLITPLFFQTSSYYFFTKNHIVNTSSLLGYYADVKLENNSTEKAELFAVSSEVTESSK